MKYTMLATALALALGSGIAAADDDPPPSDTTSDYNAPGQSQHMTGQKTQTTTTTTTSQTTTGHEADEAQAKTIPSSDLLFDFNKSTLKPDARAKLQALATWAKCNPKGALILEGNADPRGTQDYNMKLAADRASVVRQKLIDMGVPSDRIVITVYGENGVKKPTFAEDRRVTVRAVASPLQPADVTAQR